MPRRTFALTLTAYLLLQARNLMQRLLLAHGYRARPSLYPRGWNHE